MRRNLCLYLPFLATERLASGESAPAEPLLLTRPCGSALYVAHACPAARAAGVYPGLSLAEAQAICPDARAWPHDAAAEAAELERLALWAQRFSPVVQSAAPDGLCADVTGCARLFGGEEPIVRQAVAGLAGLGVRARGAIADTLGAAWALARGGSAPACVAPPGGHVALLVGLPPALLRLEAATVAALEGVGVRTIGDLLMLPRSTLPSRFGAGLVTRLRQMLGEAPEWIDAPRAAAPLAARLGFGPSDSLEVAWAAAERVLKVLCERLAAAGRAARRLLVVVYFASQPPATAEIGLSRPARDARHLRALVAPRLERLDLSGGASGLMISAVETAAWRPTQGALFDGPPPGDVETHAALLDRLANHLGRDAVVRAEPVADHQPERAFRYASLIAGEAPARRAAEPRGAAAEAVAGAAPDSGSGGADRARSPRENFDRLHDGAEAPLGPRPLRLLARPQPARVVALVPDGPPARFEIAGAVHEVAESAGPERIETGWWRGSDARRDYYRVTTRAGQRFWIYRDLETGAWFVHGVYA